jgi:hypothetical protein
MSKRRKIWPGDIWEVLVAGLYTTETNKYSRGIGLAGPPLKAGDRFIVMSSPDEYNTFLVSVWGTQYRLSKSELTKSNCKRIFCGCPANLLSEPSTLVTAYKPPPA